MLVQTLQIVWHAKEPVFSLDFVDQTTLVTAGADKEIKLWQARTKGEGYGGGKRVGAHRNGSKRAAGVGERGQRGGGRSKRRGEKRVCMCVHSCESVKRTLRACCARR